MKNDLSRYMCEICKLSFGFDRMTYSRDGKKLICRDCYNIIAKRENKPKMEIAKESKAGAAQPSSLERINVMCIDCKYKFSIKKEANTAPRCPYCGKNRLAKYDELTADRLINDASDNRGFY